MPRVLAGSPAPLGVTLTADGANIAVFSQHATRIDLCLFDPTGEREVERLALPERTGAVFHAFVRGITAGTRYGLRAHGAWAPHEGHRFDHSKLLVDPYARALDRAFRLHESQVSARADGTLIGADSAAHVPKAIVVPELATWLTAQESMRRNPSSRRAPVSLADSVIYEMHVRGFTMQHPDVPVALRGTAAGLAHPAAIEHLVKLGVTAVELLPIAAAMDESHLVKLGLSNYWGYNTVGWMVPDPRLVPGGIGELRACVEALHEAGIEVLLDIVLNHSAEGDGAGPTVSLRGLDNATYYRLVPGDAAMYVNDTGTGNALALDRAPVTQLALDTLRHWVEWAGVDGFRYDLATTIARRDDGFDPHAPLLTAISQDPVLRSLKHIAEPWDVGYGGYRLGEFPAAWAEWNDRYRDGVRHFWRGDGEHVGDLATRLAGSPDFFGTRQRLPSRSINFITAHDGFTLADLVSYESKHNEANGEGNRDGTNTNISWNFGVEGPTANHAVLRQRERDVRALLTTLLYSRGTPMLTMGDELGHTQHGNNNAYAQDNATTWIDWTKADHGLAAFTARLIALRKQHPALREDRWLVGEPRVAGGFDDVQWLHLDGQEMSFEDWSSGRVRTLVSLLTGPADDRVLVALHGGVHDVTLRVPAPRPNHHWRQVIATDAPASAQPDVPIDAHRPLLVSARSVVLLIEELRTDAPPEPDPWLDAHPPTGQRIPPMTFARSAGVLLHPTSLPGPCGIGDLGPEAHRFVDFMADAGLKVWQMLPIGPTGYGDSPYQCFSAFAGNPMLVHVPDGEGDFDSQQVEWGRVIPHKRTALKRATEAFEPDDAYRVFVRENAWWLEDFALFMALKDAHGGVQWTQWDDGARRRDSVALHHWRDELATEIEHHRRVQHFFFQQWHALRQHCARVGIQIMGDLPIYVAHDSADVWAEPRYFLLDEAGNATVQAGVPPDYFSATGQLWGNPIYNWDAMRRDGYAWWIRRMRAMFRHFDIVRIDHFRGFEAYWEVPGEDTTAINGRWVKGPGDELFSAISTALGPLPIVAENLGLITPEVEALRERLGYPGMSILQFAFNADGSPNDFQPHTYPRERVVYTGTHDNDTTLGWWNAQPGGDSTRSAEIIEAEKAFARRYLGTDGSEMHWVLIRAALASVAHTALIPMQDLLGLGSEARMNLPGRQRGNWGFRFAWPQVSPDISTRLRELVRLYQR